MASIHVKSRSLKRLQVDQRILAVGTVVMLACLLVAGFLYANRDNDAPERFSVSDETIMAALERVQNRDVVLTLAASRTTAQPDGSCASNCEISATLVLTNIAAEPIFIKQTTITSGNEGSVDQSVPVDTESSISAYGLEAQHSVGISVYGASQDEGDAFILTVTYAAGSESAAVESISVVIPKRAISQQWTPTPGA
jgi:hypothetical protein